MYEINLGFSSNCFPGKTAPEIVDILKKANSKLVDLRIGREQLWEQAGVEYFLENDVNVAFIATNIVLGDEKFTPGVISKIIEKFKKNNIKVVAAKNCLDEKHIEITKRQIKEINKLCFNKEILIETHYGYADIDTLLKINEIFNTSILLDNMGFMKITKNPLEELKLIQHAIGSIQIKGFDWSNPYESKHLPIDEHNLKYIKVILDLIYKSKSNPIPLTIETKSPTFIEDYKSIEKLIYDF